MSMFIGRPPAFCGLLQERFEADSFASPCAFPLPPEPVSGRRGQPPGYCLRVQDAGNFHP